MEFYIKVRHLLGDHRSVGFDYIFDYLKTIKDPLIVETGCARQMDNYAGDGQSSLLFDGYIQEYGGNFYTVDISKESVDYCRSRVKGSTMVFQDDSIKFLRKLNNELIADNRKIDFLYLDSFDAPRDRPEVVATSALHHFYEFTTILKSLKPGALVAVDDCWFENGSFTGKGRFIADYMNRIDIAPCQVGYQTMWKYS